MHHRTFSCAVDGRDVRVPGTMGNTAMCKVCGSDKGLRTMASLSALGQNDLPDFYCEEHFPAWSPLVLVRGHTGRCSRRCWTASSSPQRSLMWCFQRFLFQSWQCCELSLAECTQGFRTGVSFFFYLRSYFCFGHNLDGCGTFGFVIDRLLSLHELLLTTITCLPSL